MNKIKKLRKVTSDNKSNWLEESEKKLAKKGARKNARKVALRVLHILRERGMTQMELAEKMGVSRQQITKIVQGRENFTFETIDKLEKALNVTLITIGAPIEAGPSILDLYSTTIPVPAAGWPLMEFHHGSFSARTQCAFSFRLNNYTPPTESGLILSTGRNVYMANWEQVIRCVKLMKIMDMPIVSLVDNNTPSVMEEYKVTEEELSEYSKS